ncbi:hypothetical protein MNBD_GAMMA08-1386 [hydrothermal vent metagenome]|uniref:Uncharacterized protein n=1 Tax=hydrothermal vent metagenome TaxID=652676 RepID=A0A3B0XU53_9ZZZZ
MNVPTGQANIKKFSFTAVLFIGLLGLVGLQGCGSSSSTPAITTDQNASSLFTGGITPNSGTQLTDLRAFVHEGRMIIFSVKGHFLFDGQIDDITLDNYTATVDVYELGVKTESAIAVTGTVLSESKITATITGTTNLDGEITLDYDALYTSGISFERLDTNDPDSSGRFPFVGDLRDSRTGASTANFSFDTANVFDFISRISGPIRCSTDGTYIIPDANINILVTDETLSKIEAGCTMSDTPNYTGFVALVDGAFTDNTLLYASTNGENAQFAELIKELP